MENNVGDKTQPCGAPVEITISSEYFPLANTFCGLSLRKSFITRGQRPNESQKAVIIYMMKSVGEIASKMRPV